MTIILHLALLVAIGAGPVAADGNVPINFQSLKQVAKEVEAKASEEEIETLRTLLLARSKWHPNAPQLLHNVLSRPSGRHERRALSCATGGYSDNTTCRQMADHQTECNPCIWEEVRCAPSSCSDYDSQTACCANARKIKTGCYWNPHRKNYSGHVTGACVELGDCEEMAKGKCSSSFGSEATSCPEAQSVCEGLSGCQWNSCGGCQKIGTTCQCSGSSMSCSSGGGMGALYGVLTGNSGCGITDCVLCLKKDESGNMDMSAVSCDTIATRASSFCSLKCSKVVHNAAEAKCLAKNENLCGQTVAECKADSLPNSCVLPTASSTQNCPDLCTTFDAKCDTSGTKADCTPVPVASVAWSFWKHSPMFFASAVAAASLAFQ